MLPWQRARGRPLVAFSAGPYATALADGSEYDGSYADRVTEEQLLDFHRQRLQATDPDSHCCLTLQSSASELCLPVQHMHHCRRHCKEFIVARLHACSAGRSRRASHRHPGV